MSKVLSYIDLTGIRIGIYELALAFLLRIILLKNSLPVASSPVVHLYSIAPSGDCTPLDVMILPVQHRACMTDEG